MTRLFATPVDARTIAVRGEPETPLLVFVTPGRPAQLYVGTPASAPALTAAEAEPLNAFFVWDSGESTWWKTQHPAVFDLEQVTADLFVGRLHETGAIVAAGDDPRRRPDAEGYFFRVLRRPPEIIRDPCGPEILSADGSRECVAGSTATETVLARFPCFGPEVVWLRLFRPGKEREILCDRLSSESTVLRALHELAPRAVAEPLHDGRLATSHGEGRYGAFRQPLGVPLPALLGEVHGEQRRRAVARWIVADVAALMRLAHAHQLYLGPLTTSLLSVRPAPRDGAPAVAATLTALPGAGTAETRQSSSVLELFPAEEVEGLIAQFEEPYCSNRPNDLRALAHFIHEVLRVCDCRDPELAAAAEALDRGDTGALDLPVLADKGGRVAE